MKHRLLTAVVTLVVATTLAGCSIFYPNPGTTPSPTKTETQTPTPTPTPTPTVDPNLKPVDIHILDASAFRANGTIDVIAEALAILEDNGECTLVVSQGSVSQTITVKAESNVSTTQCFPMSLPLSGFKDGNLKFKVTYVSPVSSGSSSTGTISIQ
jgi:hypothetical protein